MEDIWDMIVYPRRTQIAHAHLISRFLQAKQLIQPRATGTPYSGVFGKGNYKDIAFIKTGNGYRIQAKVTESESESEEEFEEGDEREEGEEEEEGSEGSEEEEEAPGQAIEGPSSGARPKKSSSVRSMLRRLLINSDKRDKREEEEKEAREARWAIEEVRRKKEEEKEEEKRLAKIEKKRLKEERRKGKEKAEEEREKKWDRAFYDHRRENREQFGALGHEMVDGFGGAWEYNYRREVMHEDGAMWQKPHFYQPSFELNPAPEPESAAPPLTSYYFDEWYTTQNSMWHDQQQQQQQNPNYEPPDFRESWFTGVFGQPPPPQ